jgi:pimeloyl-ACP methyl ester carboxylesterase
MGEKTESWRAPAGRSFTLNADGVHVHADAWAPATPTNGVPSVLLVHGLGANTLSWEPIGQPLADALGTSVTAIDLIGFGRTRVAARTASIASNRQLVTAVLDDLGPSIVIGNSMGGSIAIGIAARRPELITSLVLVNPALPHPHPGVVDMLRLARFAPVMISSLGSRVVRTRARVLGPTRVVDASLGWSLHDPSRLDPDLRRRLIALATERYDYPEAPAGYAAAARSLLLYLARGLLTDLAAGAAGPPVLLVHGEHDRLVSLDAARDAAARNAHVELAVLDGVGHAPQLEDPERVVAILTPWLNARMSGCQTQPPTPVSSTSPSGPSSTS